MDTSWTDCKSKIVILKCFILCNNSKAFLDWIVMCDESGFYMTTGNNQFNGWTRRSYKALLTGKLAWKKGHDHCLTVCCWSDPLQLSESRETITSEKYAQQTEDLHRKPQCLQPALAYRKGPILHDNAQPHVAQPRLQKLNKLGYEVLRIHYVHLTSQSKLLLFQATQQLFARKTLLQSAGGRKCFPRVCQIPKHGFLCYRNKQTFLIGKNVLIVMVPILINEAVFEPSYNDLKFTVQNHN